MEMLKLAPAYKDYVWGGTRLKTEFGKQTGLDIIAESWELSCHPEGESRVSGGRYDGMTLSDVIKATGKRILGTNCKKFDTFPLLIKLIDTGAPLSVQVHPGDAYARKNEGQRGKTEMWYVIDHEEDAFIYHGLSRKITQTELAERIKNDTLTQVLNKVTVKKGDVFLIKPGTIHAVGKGVLLAEIQQNSNLTYRIYDYNRLDSHGNPRPLHIEKAIAVADLSPPDDPPRKDGFLAKCEYFSVRLQRVAGKARLPAGRKSFQSLLIISGGGEVKRGRQKFHFNKGDSIFIPAKTGRYSITGNCEIIITYTGEAGNNHG